MKTATLHSFLNMYKRSACVHTIIKPLGYFLLQPVRSSKHRLRYKNIYSYYLGTSHSSHIREKHINSFNSIFPSLQLEHSLSNFEVVCALGIIAARVEGLKGPQDPVCDLETGPTEAIH